MFFITVRDRNKEGRISRRYVSFVAYEYLQPNWKRNTNSSFALKACWLWRFNVSAHLWVKYNVRATCLLFLKLSAFFACYFVRMCDSEPKTKMVSRSVNLRSIHTWYGTATQQCGCWSLRVGVDVTGSSLYRHTECPDSHVSWFSSYSPEIALKFLYFCTIASFQIHSSSEFTSYCIIESI
jgi:hypothetical protein